MYPSVSSTFATAIDTLKEQPESMSSIVRSLGLGVWGYVFIKDNPTSDIAMDGNFPKHWRAEYLELQYQLIDPVVKEAFQAEQPFIWHQSRYEDTEANRVFFHRAARYNFVKGIAVPVHKITTKKHPAVNGIVSFKPSFLSQAEMETLVNENPDYLHNLVDIFLEFILEQTSPWVTSEDIEIMRLSASYSSPSRIAEELDIPSRKVSTRIKTLRERFHSQNLSGLMAYFVRHFLFRE